MSERLIAAHKIDFDHWSELAKSDPDSFEQLRDRTLSACIDRSTSSHQNRLRCLQWRIDQIRSQSGTPLAACVKISRIMWDTFNRLGSVYDQVDPIKTDNSSATRPSATILPFNKP